MCIAYYRPYADLKKALKICAFAINGGHANGSYRHKALVLFSEMLGRDKRLVRLAFMKRTSVK